VLHRSPGEVIVRGLQRGPGKLVVVGVLAALGVSQGHRPGAASGQGVAVHALVVGGLAFGLRVGAGTGERLHILVNEPLPVGAVLRLHHLVVVVVPRRAAVGVGVVLAGSAAGLVGLGNGLHGVLAEPVRGGRAELLPVHREARRRVRRRGGIAG